MTKIAACFYVDNGDQIENEWEKISKATQRQHNTLTNKASKGGVILEIIWSSGQQKSLRWDSNKITVEGTSHSIGHPTKITISNKLTAYMHNGMYNHKKLIIKQKFHLSQGTF